MASVRICLQWSIIFFNTISVIIGILAIVACLFELEKYKDDTKEQRELIVQLVAASILVISAFVGCCGAVNGSFKILLAFIGFLIVLIVTHIWKIVRYNQPNFIKSTKSMVEYQWLEELVRIGSMDYLQTTYSCCGRLGYNDYISLKLKVPESCYVVENGLKSIYPFAEGCESAVTRAYVQMSSYEKYTHYGLIGFECLGIFLSIVLIFKLTLKSRKYLY